MKETKQKIYGRLNAWGIEYHRYDHVPAHTMADCGRINRMQGIKASHCKNLFLCNRAQTQFYLLLLRGDKKFKTAEVSKQIHQSRLSFAKEDALLRYLGCTPGAISPLGLMFDGDGAVNVLIDEDVLREQQVCFHPCDNTASVVMSQEGLFGWLRQTGHGYTPIIARQKEDMQAV
ncbi:MAG: prolyl-tRNA synthetase associated domain-containing protein [Christensenellales bacterium]|jgi:Ala-tRNA(Pro) deacylase